MWFACTGEAEDSTLRKGSRKDELLEFRGRLGSSAYSYLQPFSHDGIRELSPSLHSIYLDNCCFPVVEIARHIQRI